MKILFLTNNDNSKPLSDWLSKHEEVTIFKERLTTDIISHYKPEIIISYNYRYIIKEDVINLMPLGRIINLHVSLLPWNKCASPNIWSFLENTPKGVTIQVIDKGVDTGKILLQKEIFFDENKETVASSYNTLQKEIQNLFISNWDKIKNMELPLITQEGKGSYHSAKDFDVIRHLLEPEGWNIKISELKKRYILWKSK